jgi:hypothetical protein
MNILLQHRSILPAPPASYRVMSSVMIPLRHRGDANQRLLWLRKSGPRMAWLVLL